MSGLHTGSLTIGLLCLAGALGAAIGVPGRSAVRSARAAENAEESERTSTL